MTGYLPDDSIERQSTIFNEGKDPLIQPVSHNAAIPAHANNAILKAMNIKPEERYQQVEEFMANLTDDNKQIPIIQQTDKELVATCTSRRAELEAIKKQFIQHETPTTNREDIKNINGNKWFLKSKWIIGIIAGAILLFGLLVSPVFKNHKEYCSGDAVFVSGSDVYVAGHICKGSSTTNCPTLWINGVPQSIGKVGNFNSAKSVFVSGNDVYVAITEREQNRALLWKNGVSQQLGGVALGNEANSVFVAGSDVYVAGVDNDKPTLWKNGVPQYLSNAQGSANSVVVSNGDVYVVGCKGDYSDREATLWKNGVSQKLSEDLSEANSIFISDGDVYVAGEERRVATLWKNGIIQQLNCAGNNNSAHSVAVSNDDVYVVGICGATTAALWKNGVYQYIKDEIGYQAMSVVVVNNKVYIAGESINTCPLWIFDIEEEYEYVIEEEAY
jgi:hypothetical protein